MSDQGRTPQQYPTAPPVVPPYRPKRAARTGAIIAVVVVVALSCVAGGAFIAMLVDAFSRTPGAAYFPPKPESVIATQEWGEVPVSYIGVVLRDGQNRREAEALATTLGGKVIGEVADIGLYQISTTAVDEAGLRSALEAARAQPDVEFAFPDQAVMLDVTGVRCTPLAETVYAGPVGRTYNVIGVQRAWDTVKASGVPLSEVRVAVLDDGLWRASGEFDGAVRVDTSGAEDLLADKLFEDGATVPEGSHGTAVSSIIAADPDNAGLAGVASVLGDKMRVSMTNIWGAEYGTDHVVDPTSGKPTYQDSDGFSWSIGSLVAMKKQISDGATIINCSWGNSQADPAVAAAYKRFFEQTAKSKPNVLFVCSAGNEGQAVDGARRFPGGLSLPNMITVGAVDGNGRRTEFSNTSSANYAVDIAAPGGEVPIGMADDGSVITAGGTSFATPQVTATAAMLRALDPSMDAAALKELILATAAPGVTNAEGTESVPAPEALGGRVLSAEFAVLAAANQVRAAKGLPPLDGASLGSVRIDLTAQPTADGRWDVVADVPDVGPKGTTVELTYNGAGSIGGRTTQKLAKSGKAKWIATVSGDSMTVHVKRADTGACWRVVVKGDGAPPAAEQAPPAAPADPGFVGWFYFKERPQSEKRGADLRINIDPQGNVTGTMVMNSDPKNHRFDVAGVLRDGQFNANARSLYPEHFNDWQLVGSVKDGVLTITPVGWSGWQMNMQRE